MTNNESLKKSVSLVLPSKLKSLDKSPELSYLYLWYSQNAKLGLHKAVISKLKICSVISTKVATGWRKTSLNQARAQQEGSPNPRLFQPQTSTLDLSTPDFSTLNFPTPDFSTMNFWTMVLKKSWMKSPGLNCLGLKSLGLKCHSTDRMAVPC